jgi:deazaflavin-dependent oxidoreductase (nitroreductase family)
MEPASRKTNRRSTIELSGASAPPGNGIPFYVPMMNPLMKSLLRLGVPLGPMTLITVRGRKSGKPRTTPVGILETDSRKFIFGTFGDVGWTKNLRASGEVKIGRGRRRRTFSVRELGIDERAEVLRKVLAPYLSSPFGSSFLKMGYDLSKDSSMADYLVQAARHPGFELMEDVGD